MPSFPIGSFYSGLSGLQLDIPQYQFPAPFQNASRLTYYASLFNSLECNSSFYKIPRPATIARWADAVNDHFKFTFKLWREITHSKPFNFKSEDVALFFNAINEVREKKGCLLIQFPPSLDIHHIHQLRKLLDVIKDVNITQEWKIAVEFRHKSWYHESVYELLDMYKASVVIHDIPKSATPLLDQVADFIYIRFHGPTGNYRGSYSPEHLNEYAAYIHEWMEEGKTVFVYFNNTMGEAINNLRSLNSFLNEKIDT